MAEIRIDYYGHSCFRVSYGTHSCIFDPYARHSVPGTELPEGLSADVVYCSHDHGDHNARDLIRETSDGNDPFRAVSITVPHDDQNGRLRGMNRITLITAGGCRIAHYGDTGRLLTDDEYQIMKSADVVLIPVGGHFTIDARQAKEIIDRVAPKLTILMHYRKGNRGYDVIADIQEIAPVFPQLKQLNETSVSFDESNVPQGIITLEPLQ